MPDHSDSDSSPKAPSSRRGGSSSGEEERLASRPADDDPNAYADPESPSNAHQSSDESGSSDGVLVELPGNPDQDSRGVRGDPDSGILVNIDGSMQEPQDDGGKEETFEDASDHLGLVGSGARSSGLEESMAVIEIGERSSVASDDLARLQSRLDEALTECRKYKEEREIFGRDIFNLQQQLQHVITAAHKEDLYREVSEHEESMQASRTPLHSMLNDCQRFIHDLKSILDERFDHESKASQLQETLYIKDQQIEDLSLKASEASISYDVIISYLDSLRYAWTESVTESTGAVVKRLLSSISPIIGEEYASLEGSGANEIFLMEKKISLFVEKHARLLSDVHQLRQCLMDGRPEFATLEGHETSNILSFACEELYERKRKEVYLQERIEGHEEENRKLSEHVNRITESLDVANAETKKLKAELEQTEAKFAAAKEKLSIAVSKGKSLVQHRDSLKQSLAEKANELERCMQELQQKSDALQDTERHLEELKQILSEKTSELEKCFEDIRQKAAALEAARETAGEIDKFQSLVGSLQDSLLQKDTFIQDIEEALSQTDIPQDVLSMDTIDKARWFVNQKNIADIVLLENQKTREAISSVEFPEDVSLDSRINWLVSSFSHAQHEISMLQDEINGARLSLSLNESQLLDAQKEIDILKSSMLGEKHAKDSLQDELDDLKCKYEGLNEKLSLSSSEKDGLLKVLAEMSESTLDDVSSADTSAVVEKCFVKFREKMVVSLVDIEKFEKLQSLLYLRDQDLRLCEMILEEEIIVRSSMSRLSEELARVSEVVVSLKNDNDLMQKELERAEEKSALLREKLSLAVKKGKGLVQEREGLKLSLDEKSSEITNLKQDLQLKDAEITEYQQRIENLSSLPEHIQKLESEIVFLKDQRDQNDRNLHELKSTLQNLIDSVDKINLPVNFIFEGPLEKVNLISDYIKTSEFAKINAIEELNKVKEEARLQGSQLDDAFATMKSLEEDLSKAQTHISFINMEMSGLQTSKASTEQELEEVRNENSVQSDKLTDALSTIKSLEDALLEAERHFNLVNGEKDKTNAEIRKENAELKAKLAECMEELVGSRKALENYKAEINSQLERLRLLLKDDSLLSKVSENLTQKVELLRNMGLLIQNMHDQVASKGFCLNLNTEHESLFAKLSSLPDTDEIMRKFSAYIKNKSTDYADMSSLAMILEGLRDQAKFLVDTIDDSSTYLGDYITDVSESFKGIRDELLHVFELNESLKLHVESLKANNQAHETKAASVQEEIMILLSACVDATQELSIDFSDSRDVVFTLEQEPLNSTLDSRSNEDNSTGIVDSVANEYTKAAEKLLFASKRVRSQWQQLANAEKVALRSIEEMKARLQEAEFSVEDATQARKLDQEKVSALEKDLEALKDVCREMKSEINNYQTKEVAQGKEQASPIGIGGQIFSKRQMETLIDKVNQIQIPFTETEIDFPTPVEKLIYIIDKVVEIHNRMDALIDEKEDMQLILSSHLREIEHLKNAAETNGSSYQELQSKKTELSELTFGLERIIQKLGGYDLVQDQKPVTVKTLLEILERLTTATSLDFESSKSKIQELGAKLQEKDKVIDKWTMRFKMLEDSIQARTSQQDVTKDRAVLESSSTALSSEISEVEDGGSLGKNSISSVSTAPHVRTMRKGSSDHLVLSIDSDSERLISSQEIDDKGHIFMSLNTSGLIPKQGKLIADRVDGLWVSGGRLLMHRPRARLGLMAYWIFLHLWLLGTIL